MVTFFRIKEGGSIKSPTVTAVVVSFVLWVLTGILLRNSIVWAVVFMLLEYILAALIFAKPLRIPLQKILYATRYPLIVGGTRSIKMVKWLNANREMLQRSNLVVFHGVGAVGGEALTKIHDGEFKNTIKIDTDSRPASWENP